MGTEDPDYQVGARFEALDEEVLAAASKSTGYFFAISISQKVRCPSNSRDGFTLISVRNQDSSGIIYPQSDVIYEPTL